MDRSLVYAGQVPRSLDVLKTGEFAMVGLAKLAEAMLGSSTIVSNGGFAVSPASGLSITVGPGQVYQLQSIEPTTQSSLTVDGHQVLKQGVALDAQTLTLTPPGAVGQAQNFLLQVAYQDVQDGSVVLSYQNPTPVLDPSTNAYKYVTYPGPGGNGQANFTILRGGVSVIAKPGTAAPSGSQTTPAPDAGYVGLSVITLAYGATSVSNGNITSYSGAPFIPLTLPQIPAAIQAQAGNYAADTGTANAMAVSFPGYTPTTLVAGTPVRIKKGPNANTGALTAAIGGTTYPVVSVAGSALVGQECPAGALLELVFDGTSLRMAGPALNATSFTTGVQSYTTAGNVTFTAPITGIYKVTAWGGGGGGGYSGAASSAGGGGGPGGSSFTYFYLTAGTAYPAVVGSAGLGGSSPTLASGGGTTSFNNISLATGGSPGVSAGSASQAGAGGNPGTGYLNNNIGYVPPSENGSQGYNVGTILGGKGGSAALSGGPGGAQSLGNGNPGVVPGGGGGGGVNGYGGNGGAGGLRIEW